MTNLAPGVQTAAFPYPANETSVLFATECVDTLLGTLVEQRKRPDDNFPCQVARNAGKACHTHILPDS